MPLAQSPIKTEYRDGQDEPSRDDHPRVREQSEIPRPAIRRRLAVGGQQLHDDRRIGEHMGPNEFQIGLSGRAVGCEHEPYHGQCNAQQGVPYPSGRAVKGEGCQQGECQSDARRA